MEVDHHNQVEPLYLCLTPVFSLYKAGSRTVTTHMYKALAGPRLVIEGAVGAETLSCEHISLSQRLPPSISKHWLSCPYVPSRPHNL